MITTIIIMIIIMMIIIITIVCILFSGQGVAGERGDHLLLL